MVLSTKTAASLKKQLFDDLDAQNQLLAAELKLKKNPERYLSSAIGFVADHLEYGCVEGVQIIKISVSSVESFVAVRMTRAEFPPLLDKFESLLAKVAEEPLSLLTAIDLHQLGAVDKLYAADQDYLWSIDLSKRHSGEPYAYRLARFTPANALSHLRVVRDPEGDAVRLYFLGQQGQKKGVFMIKDPLRTLNSGASWQQVLSVVTLIIEGDYRALLVRFGRIILMPTDPKRKAEALDLPTHQRAPVEDKLGRIAFRKIKK